MPRDLLNREIRTGDYVVFNNRLYEVKQAGHRSSVSIELVENQLLLEQSENKPIKLALCQRAT